MGPTLIGNFDKLFSFNSPYYVAYALRFSLEYKGGFYGPSFLPFFLANIGRQKKKNRLIFYY